MIAVLLALVGGVLALATLPGTVELVALTLGGVLPARRATRVRGPLRTGAVVVPAHDEEAGIARCVRSLLEARRAGPPFDVVVVADNCTDATAVRAREAGARVLERHDLSRRGKGYALEYAFDILLSEGLDAVVVVDADTVVERNFFAEVERLLGEGADAVQARYGVSNPGASLRTRLMNVALLAFNVLRPRGRDRWGLSAGILGNGFALSRETLAAVPYTAHSVVEDLEYHLRLVRAGRRVWFADATTVRADMPVGGRGVATQRARWEGGRLRMIVDVVPALVREVLGGRWRLLEPLGELLLLPLAFHVLLLLLTLAVPFAPTRVYAAGALVAVALHVAAGLLVGGGTWRDVMALVAAPGYLLWKVAIAPAIARTARRDSAWVRTERRSGGGKGA